MKRRLRACVEAWPECSTGEYNPHCCRFPKSCSCDIYDEEHVTEADLAVPCQEPERSALVDGEAQWTADTPRWRDPLWRLRNNWAQQWKLGPIRFEIEWVPKARNFDFWLCFDFSGGRYDG